MTAFWMHLLLNAQASQVMKRGLVFLPATLPFHFLLFWRCALCRSGAFQGSLLRPEDFGGRCMSGRAADIAQA